MGRKSPKGKNTYFTQTASVLRAAAQTKIFSRIKRNIPYAIKISKKVFAKRVQKLKSVNKKTTKKFVKKLPKYVQKYAKRIEKK